MDVLMPDGTTITDVPEGTTKAQLLAKYQGSQSGAQVPGLSQGMDALGQIPRQLGLTARAAIGGVASIPNLVLDPAVALINKGLAAAQSPKLSDLVTGKQPYQLPIPSQAMERTLSRFLPEPQNAMERVVQAGARAMVPVAGSIQLGRAVPALASLAQSPVVQLASGASGGAASQGAAEAGAGPMGQMGAGLLGGIAGPAALLAANAGVRAALRVPGSWLSPLTSGGQKDMAAQAYQSSAKNLSAARDAMNAGNYEIVPGSVPTTAEVANDSGISSLFKTLRNKDTGAFSDAEKQRDIARQAFLAQQFGTPQDLILARSQREAATAPLRDSALNAANQTGQDVLGLQGAIQQKAASKAQALQQSGQMATGAAQQDVLANNYVPVPGMPRVPAALSPNLENVPAYQSGAGDAARIAMQRQAEKTALEGQLAQIPYTPLQSAPIVNSIRGTLNVPGIRASDVASKTLSDVQAKLAALTDQNGLIDARDLYTVRKELGNTIEKNAKDTNNWDKRMTAGLERDIQGAMDDAIVGAGGKDWPQYLQAYKDASVKINAMQTGQDVMKGATNPSTGLLSPAQFAREVEANGPEIAGAGARASDALARVNMDLKRSVAPMAAMRTAGSDTVQNTMNAGLLGRMLGKLPGGFVAGTAAKVADWLYTLPRERVQQLMVDGMIDPRLGTQLLARKLPDRPDLLAGLLAQRGPVSSGGLLGAMSNQ